MTANEAKRLRVGQLVLVCGTPGHVLHVCDDGHVAVRLQGERSWDEWQPEQVELWRGQRTA